MSKMDELIIVAPRSAVFANGTFSFQGLQTNPAIVKEILHLVSENCTIMRRGDAEEDSTYKQPIPYVIVRQGDKIFAYRRLSGGGETRLHDQLSIGVGGHMNHIASVSFHETVESNLRRELNEELTFTPGDRDVSPVMAFNYIGLINDDENEVGRVHIGLLVVLDISEDIHVEVKETEQLEGFWFTNEELSEPDVYAELESWSQYAIQAL